MQRLADNIADLKNHYTVVVVGSGYGASIAASRMARAQQKVCVLERGKEWIPGEYPRTPLQAAKEMQVDFPEEHVGRPQGYLRFSREPRHLRLPGLRIRRDLPGERQCFVASRSSRLQDQRWPVAIRAEATRMAGGDGADVLLSKGYHWAEEMLKPTPYPDAFPALPKLAALDDRPKNWGPRSIVLLSM